LFATPSIHHYISFAKLAQHEMGQLNRWGNQNTIHNPTNEKDPNYLTHIF
jgi:hypothetical protein